MRAFDTAGIYLPNGTRAYMLSCPVGAQRLSVREDGRRIEALCEHGVGHCIASIGPWEDWMGVHGCDGCCSSWLHTDDSNT